MNESSTVGELRDRVVRRLETENELVVDPEYFRALAARLPGTPFADIQLRRGRSINETTAYHYDVFLDFAHDRRPRNYVTEHHAWGTPGCQSLADIEALLDAEAGRPVAIADIADALLAADLALAEAVDAADDTGHLGSLSPSLNASAVHPEDLWELAEHKGLAVHLTWLSPGQIGAIFYPNDYIRPAWPEEFDASTDPAQYLREPAAPATRHQENSLIPALREHLSRRLPEYMIPAQYVVLDRLPLTPNGKVDRKALPAPTEYAAPGEETAATASHASAAAPHTETEQKLHAIWRDVLGISQIGIHDSFFELGGDSILGFQVTARANAERLPLTPRLFFQHRTIVAMSAALDAEPVAAPAQKIRRIERVARVRRQ